MRPALERVLRTLGVLVYFCGLRRLVMWINRRTPRVLLYHACQPQEDDYIGGLGSNTPPQLFARHIAFLARHYRVVPLAMLESGSIPERGVVITFDDGYRSTYTHAFPVLRAARLPATVYLVTDVVGTDRLVWVNELNYFLRRHATVACPLAAAALDCPATANPEQLLFRAVFEYDPGTLATLLNTIRAAAGPERIAHPRLYVTWDEVREMCGSGITFGSHTASHPNLARMDELGQREELVRARDRLAKELGAPTSVAYPFGSHGGRSAALARETGHISVMEVGGDNTPLDLSCVGRIPVTARTDAELFAEIEIVGPMRGWIRRTLRSLAGRRQR